MIFDKQTYFCDVFDGMNGVCRLAQQRVLPPNQFFLLQLDGMKIRNEFYLNLTSTADGSARVPWGLPP